MHKREEQPEEEEEKNAKIINSQNEKKVGNNMTFSLYSIYSEAFDDECRYDKQNERDGSIFFVEFNQHLNHPFAMAPNHFRPYFVAFSNLHCVPEHILKCTMKPSDV